MTFISSKEVSVHIFTLQISATRELCNQLSFFRIWMPKTRMKTLWIKLKDRRLCPVVFAKVTIGPPVVPTRTPWVQCRRSWLNNSAFPLLTRTSLLAPVRPVLQSIPSLSSLQLIVDALFWSPWAAEPEPVQPAQSKTGKYVPPSLRDGGTRRGESMQPNRRGAFALLLCYVWQHWSSRTFLHQQLMTTLLFVWLICLRTLVRRTYKNSLDHLVPSQGSTWPRTRTLGSRRSVLVLKLAWGR